MFNEYEVMKRLSHPNIIRCYGYFWEFPTQSLYIVLEYANRGDLHGELQTRKRLGKHFSDNEVWDVLAQVLRGLRHIHARGIVHRDIKTMNLLLNDEGVIKLGDFGVSRQMSENTVCLHSFYGTPLYLSPELIEGRAYSRTTDIWSLGVVLYELLSLQLPFRGPSLQDVIAAVLRCRFSPLPSWRPQEFSDVVNSMLTKDAQRRPSAESLLQRMEYLGKLFRPPKAVQEDPRPVEPKPPDKENRSPAAVARNEGHQVVRVRSRPSSAGPQVKLIEPDAPPPGATGPLHVVKNLREERWEQRRLAHAPAPYAVEKLQGRPSSIGEFNHREQFEILKDLQSNDSGSVHVARIKKGEELVVLKRRRAPELGKAKDVLNEYEIMKKLNHSNIIRCYGYFWDFPSQSLYIVLEYANRGDLHWELQKRKRLGKPFGDEEIWDILAQVLMGLCHIHARGIVHRDIKAMNLFLTSDGVIKLGDFGVSRQMSEKTLCLQSFYGTPLYFSPEMIEGQTYTNTTDIWSLGVVLYAPRASL
ncbi:rskn-1 [Symbiodinium sp. CCMP2456]|nr:rskn-1 [Symbiodinium sp. CCMP2456]